MGFIKHLIGLALCLLPIGLEANSYGTPGNDYPLVDLVGNYYNGNSDNSILCQGAADETGCNIAFGIGFDFEWHGETFTHGLMSTNGCLKLLKSSTFDSTMDYCSYGVDHLGPNVGMDNTLFPFWADLDLGSIYDTQAPYQSTMLFNNDTPGYTVFGWYYMREYGVTADTDQFDPQYPNAHNTFELILLDQNCSDCAGNTDDENDDYAYLYGNLEINHSNVLVGEKKDSDNFNEAYFFSDNSYCETCIDPNTGLQGRYLFIWDDYDNGTLEGQAMYADGNGTEPAECASDPLYSTECSLYSVSYLADQCSADPSYSSQCAGYYDKIDELLDSQQECYNDPNLPGCAGLGIFDTTSQYDYATGNMGPYYSPNDFGEMDGYDPNTGLVTQSDGSQISIQGDYYSDGYDPNVDYDSINSNTGDDFYMNQDGVYVPNQYDPMEDDSIEYEYLNGEQQMLVDQGLSLQEAVLITMGTDDIIALGHDPSIQFQGNNPGDLVMDTIGLENYDLELHDETMLKQAEENGFVNGFTTSDIWATEEYMLEQELYDQQFEEQYGDDAYGWSAQEWYEYDVKEFGQDQVDEWYGKDVVFTEDGHFEWETYDYALDDEYLMELYYEDDMEFDLAYEQFLSDEIDLQKECPTCDIEAFFDLSDDELIAFENERMYEEEAYFELGPEADLERFIQEEGLEDLLSEEDLEQFKNEAYAEMDEYYEEGPMMEEHHEENGPVHFADASTPESNTEREQKQEKADKQFVGNVGAGVMSLSVAEFNIDFGNSNDTSYASSETQQQLETIIADIIDDGSSSVDDGSSSVDDGSSSGNDGSGQFAQGNDGSNSNTGYNDGSSQGNMGMLTQESSTGDTFFQEQSEQNMGQQSFDATTSTTDTVDTGAFEVATSSAEAQTVQQEETLQFVDSFDDGTGGGVSGADIQFEDELTDALASGTGLTEFLSQQTPDYNKYEIEAPTQLEVNQFEAVASLADTMGAEVAQANLTAELESIQDGGEQGNEYGDQTVAVAYIGYTAGFSEYTSQMQLADQQAWYGSSQVYKGNKPVDNKASFYMMAGNTQEKLKQMIYSQYKAVEKQTETEK